MHFIAGGSSQSTNVERIENFKQFKVERKKQNRKTSQEIVIVDN